MRFRSMKNRNVELTGRRFVLAGLLVLPFAALAHPGHGGARFLTEVRKVRVRGRDVSVRIELLNLDSNPIELTGARVDGAEVGIDGQRNIPGFGGVDVTLTATFTNAPPGVFTVMLEFGEHGSGPVAVKI